MDEENPDEELTDVELIRRTLMFTDDSGTDHQLAPMGGVELIRKTLLKTRDAKCHGCETGRRIYWKNSVRWHASDTGVGTICFGSFERSLLELPDEKLLASVEKEEWPHPTHLERYKALLDRMNVPYKEEHMPGGHSHIRVSSKSVWSQARGGTPLDYLRPVMWAGPTEGGFTLTFGADIGNLLFVGVGTD